MKDTFSLYFPSLIILRLKCISQLCSNENIDEYVLITYRYTLIDLFPQDPDVRNIYFRQKKISLQIDTT